jgi:hypothetical protein
MADFLPSKDQDLDAWATNFSARITLAPTTYGLVAGDATALATLVTGFSSALATATNPVTRTAGTVAAKDTARAVLVADIRSLARRIQAFPSVTAQQKADLGLPIHDAVPTPVPPPATKPIVTILEKDNKVHVIRLADETTPNKRARPVGTSGAEVYSFVGPNPPGDLEGWRFEGIASRSDFDVDFNSDDVGKVATIVARWFNRKGEVGPVSNPITGTIAA